jgi:glycosyltransferase involved in cell wall biosynthesis
MKIFLPFAFNGLGGVATFAKKFRAAMERQGHMVVFEQPESYDLLFLVVQAPFRYLRDAKRKSIPIIQRLDGVFYYSVVGFRFPPHPLLNLKAKLIRHLYADFTIYQSRYSQKVCRRFLGRKKDERSEVIYNGVDIDLFSPSGETVNLRDNPDQIIFFAAASFRRKDQLFPVLQALDVFRSRYGNNFKFVMAGDFTRELEGIEARLASFPNVQYIGKIANEDLPRYERGADVFVFMYLNPACPNAVLEAMACGLPICGIADGAMPELVTHGKEGMLSPAYGDAFWKKRKYDLASIADNLHHILSHREEFSRAARKKACSRFTLASMTDRYAKAFGKLKP